MPQPKERVPVTSNGVMTIVTLLRQRIARKEGGNCSDLAERWEACQVGEFSGAQRKRAPSRNENLVGDSYGPVYRVGSHW